MNNTSVSDKADNGMVHAINKQHSFDLHRRNSFNAFDNRVGNDLCMLGSTESRVAPNLKHLAAIESGAQQRIPRRGSLFVS